MLWCGDEEQGARPGQDCLDIDGLVLTWDSSVWRRATDASRSFVLYEADSTVAVQLDSVLSDAGPPCGQASASQFSADEFAVTI